jgi:hypothetical protein
VVNSTTVDTGRFAQAQSKGEKGGWGLAAKDHSASANPEHTPWRFLSGKLSQGQVAAVTLGPSTTWFAPVSFDHIVAHEFFAEQC